MGLKRQIAIQATILGAYLATGFLSFFLAIPPGFLAPVWLPAAVGLAAAIHLGYRALPAIGLGMMGLTLPYGLFILEAGWLHALAGSAGIGISAMVQAEVGRRLVQPDPGKPLSMESAVALVRLILLGGVVASLAGALIATTWLIVGAFAPPQFDWPSMLARNWAGNAVGAAALTPVILVLTDRERVSPQRKRNVALTFVLLSAICLGTFTVTRLNAREDQREQFESHVSEDHVALQERLNGARRRMESLEGFFAASETVTPAEFRTFVDIAFGQFDSVSSVHWMVIQPTGDSPGNAAPQHALIAPLEDLRLDAGRTLMVSGGRNLATNYYFEGLPDLLTATLTRGDLAASPLHGSGQTAWFALAIPAFEARYNPDNVTERREVVRGLAVGTFRLNTILDRAFAHEDHVYDYRVRGISAEGVPVWSYGSAPAEGLLSTTREIRVGGQLWQIDFVATDRFLASEQDWVSWAVLMVGLCFITVLNALALMSTAQTDLVQRLVDAKTAETRALSNNLSLILEHAADAIMSFDAEGRGILVNPAAAELFGYDPEEMTGAVIHDLIHPVDMHGRPHSRDECTMIEDAKLNSPHHGFDRFRRKDGSDFFAEFATETVRDDRGREIGAVTVVRDITARIEAEADRERFIERLTRANEELERFAFVASHDLQEPLRLISNFTGLLASRYSDALDERGLTYIRHTLDATTRMQALITDLLAYGRLNSDADTTREAIDLNKVVEDALDTLGPDVQAVRSQIRVAPLPVVRGHPARLGQLMQNLIGNAVKFQPAGQTAEVSISAEDLGDAWAITVSDNGIGIRREYREQIFQPFKRLHSPDAFPGSGMGLAICRKIVESHGGVLTVEDNDPGGSRFRFTLPKSGPTHAATSGLFTTDTAS